MVSLENTVRELQDRAAIHDLLLRYAHAVDRRDLEQVASCFTPDAAYQGSLGEGTIQVALSALSERMGRYRTTTHLLANQLVEIRGDMARSETYAPVYHRLDEDLGAHDLIVAVRYLDDLQRSSDGWLICKRVTKMEWQRYDAVELPPGT
jgi:ketosteroid isomerase-like protein